MYIQQDIYKDFLLFFCSIPLCYYIVFLVFCIIIISFL